MKGGDPPVLLTEPRDPVLRAIWRVSIADDLTPTERMALLALWRYLRGERKPIGPALLAGLIGVKRDTARLVLRALRRKGYIGCAGNRQRKTGKAAERWLTDRIKWPTTKRKVGAPIPTPGDRCAHTQVSAHPGTGIPERVGTGIPADLGVRQTAALSVPDTRPKSGGRADDETSDVEIADVIFGGGES